MAADVAMRSTGTGSLLRQTLGLTGATVLAQALGAVSLLVQVRSLSAEDIGHLQTFTSLAAIVGSVGLLSYPSVLPHLPDRDAADLSAALLMLAVIAALVAVPVALYLGIPLPPAMAIQILASCVLGMSDALNLRFGRLDRIATSRIAAGAAVLAWNVLIWQLGSAALDPILWGQSTLSVLVALGFAIPALRMARVHDATWAGARDVLVKKRGSPMYLAPSELLGSLAFNLPTLLIEHWFGAVRAGQFGVVTRLAAPVPVVSATLGQSYHASLAAAVRASDRTFYPRFREVRRKLGATALAAAVLGLLVGPTLVGVLVGRDSDELGTIVRVMTPVYATMIWASPLANASLQVFEAQRWLLGLQVASIVGTALAFGAGHAAGSFVLALGAYSALISVRYLVMLVAASRLSSRHLQEPVR